MKAVILAAGKGSRLSPITDTVPKPLITIGPDGTFLDYILESLPKEIDEVLLVTAHLSDKIQKYIDSRKDKRKYTLVIQDVTNTPGTMSALLAVREYIDSSERFLVLQGDDLHDSKTISDMLDKEWVMAVGKGTLGPGYLTYELEGDKFLKARKQTEQEEATGAIFATGLYLLDTRIFDLQPVESGGETSLPLTMIDNNSEIPITVHQDPGWLSANTQSQLTILREKLK